MPALAKRLHGIMEYTPRVAALLSSHAHTEASICSRRLGDPVPGLITEPAHRHHDKCIGKSASFVGNTGRLSHTATHMITHVEDDHSFGHTASASPDLAAATMAAFTWAAV